MAISAISNGESSSSARSKINNAFTQLGAMSNIYQDYLCIDPVNGSDTGSGTIIDPVRTPAQAIAIVNNDINKIGNGVLCFPGDCGSLDLSTTTWRPCSIIGITNNGADWVPRLGEPLNAWTSPDTSIIKTEIKIVLDPNDTGHVHIYSNYGVAISLESTAQFEIGDVTFVDALVGSISVVGRTGNDSDNSTAERGGHGCIASFVRCVVLYDIEIAGGPGGIGESYDGGAGGDAGAVRGFSTQFLGSINISEGMGGAGNGANPGQNGSSPETAYYYCLGGAVE